MIRKTKIQGVYTIRNDSFEDLRGTIREIYRNSSIQDKVSPSFSSVQVTHTRAKANTLRGLHAQAWDRIVYPLNGKIFQVLVDIRENSPTFKKVETYMIDDSNRKAFFVPAYVANGYFIGEQDVDYLYFLEQYYDENYNFGIRWDDPELKISWPIIIQDGEVVKPVISEKDKRNPLLKDFLK